MKLEGLAGDPARHFHLQTLEGASAPFTWLHRGKTIRSADATEPVELGDLLAHADVILLDREEHWVEHAIIAGAERVNPRLFVCRLSPYGETGPLADLPGAEIVVQALAGHPGAKLDGVRRLGIISQTVDSNPHKGSQLRLRRRIRAGERWQRCRRWTNRAPSRSARIHVY